MAKLSRVKQAEYDAWLVVAAERNVERQRRWAPPGGLEAAERRLAAARERATASAALVTPAMRHRQGIRTGAGRYESYGGCDLCGKSIGMDYYSHPRCNEWGVGVQLHRRCQETLLAMGDDAAHEALLASHERERAVQRPGEEGR